MKTALMYIFVVIVAYVIVDILLYLISSSSVRRLFKLARKAFKSGHADEALKTSKEFHEALLNWIEHERKLEYKSVWVGNRLANEIDDLLRLWRNDWEAEFIAELEKTASTLRSFYPKYLRALFKAVFAAVLLAFFIRTFFIQAFKIPSGSMIPTLYVGDQLLVNKFKYGIESPFSDKKLIKLWSPQRGDVVVFKPPKSVESSWVTHTIKIPFTDKVVYSWRSQVDFIKRIVGLPGDTIEIREGILYINGEPMEIKPLENFDYEKKYGEIIRTFETQVYEERIDGKKHFILHDSAERMKYDNFGPVTVKEGEFFAMGDNRDDSADSRTWVEDPAKLEDIRGKALIIHFSWDPIHNIPRINRIGTLIK